MEVEIDQTKHGDVHEVRVYLDVNEVHTWLERWHYEEGDTLSIYVGDTVVRLIIEGVVT